jgi:hypothetical protein
MVRTLADNGTRGLADAENPFGASFYGMEGCDLSPDEAFLDIADGNNATTMPFPCDVV